MPIKGYENDFFISKDGRVKSLPKKLRRGSRTGYYIRKELILKNKIVGNGYLAVCLFKKNFYIHRLIAIHFIPNPKSLPQVNHKNGIKVDNRIANLEWVTPKENINHAFRNGFNKFVEKNNKHRSKRTVQKSISGKVIRMLPSTMEFKRRFGFAHSNISLAIKNKKAAYGYYWEYR